MDRGKASAIFFAICLVLTPTVEARDNCGWSKWDYLAMAGGAAIAVVAAPVVIGAMGFTSGGIAAGSLAANGMSL